MALKTGPCSTVTEYRADPTKPTIATGGANLVMTSDASERRAGSTCLAELHMAIRRRPHKKRPRSRVSASAAAPAITTTTEVEITLEIANSGTLLNRR